MNTYQVLIRTYTVEKVKIRAKTPAGATENAERREYEEKDVIKVQDGGVDYTEILGYWDKQGTYHDQHEDEMTDEELEGEEEQEPIAVIIGGEQIKGSSLFYGGQFYCLSCKQLTDGRPATQADVDLWVLHPGWQVLCSGCDTVLSTPSEKEDL